MKRNKRIINALSIAATLMLAMTALPVFSEESVCTVEAEAGTLPGHAHIIKSGDNAWVDGLENDGDGVSVKLSIPDSGFYDVAVRFDAADTRKTISKSTENAQGLYPLILPPGLMPYWKGYGWTAARKAIS